MAGRLCGGRVVSVLARNCLAGQEQARGDQKAAKKAEQARARKKTLLSPPASAISSPTPTALYTPTVDGGGGGGVSTSTPTVTEARETVPEPAGFPVDNDSGNGNHNSTNANSDTGGSRVTDACVAAATATDGNMMTVVAASTTYTREGDNNPAVTPLMHTVGGAKSRGKGKGRTTTVDEVASRRDAEGAGGRAMEGCGGGEEVDAACSESDCLEGHIRGLRSGGRSGV